MYATKRDSTIEPRRGSLDAGIVREFETALERNELVVHYQPILRLAGRVGYRRRGARTAVPPGARGRLTGGVHPARRAHRADPSGDDLRRGRRAPNGCASSESADIELGVSVNVPYRAIDDPELAAGIEALLATSGNARIGADARDRADRPGRGRRARPGRARRAPRSRRADRGRRLRARPPRSLRCGRCRSTRSRSTRASSTGSGRNAGDSAVVQALTGLGHELGLEVVAEGVETRLAWDAAAGPRLRPCPGLLRPRRRRVAGDRAAALARPSCAATPDWPAGRPVSSASLHDFRRAQPRQRTRRRPATSSRRPARAAASRSDAAPVACAPSHAPGIAPAMPAPSSAQSTSSVATCVRKPASPSRKPTTQVRPGGGRDVHPDRPQERGHPQRPEDDADGTADRADHEPVADAAPEPEPLSRPGAIGRSATSTPLQTSTAATAASSAARGIEPPTSEPATAPTIDGGAIHATTRQFDTARPRVPKPTGPGCRGRDGDVGARTGRRAARGDQDQRQPQRAEHEPEHRADVPGDERPGEPEQQGPDAHRIGC